MLQTIWAYFFFLKEGGSKIKDLHKIKIQKTELIIRFYCIFLTLSCLVKTAATASCPLSVEKKKKAQHDNREDRINTVQLQAPLSNPRSWLSSSAADRTVFQFLRVIFF